MGSTRDCGPQICNQSRDASRQIQAEARLSNFRLYHLTSGRNIMIRQDSNRIEPKRRTVLDHRKKQFAEATYKETQYSTRLNIYAEPPTAEITLEQFEQWAIDRLHGASLPYFFCRMGHTGRARDVSSQIQSLDVRFLTLSRC